MKNIWVILLLIIILIASFLIFTCKSDSCYVFEWQKIRAADSFQRCADLGFPILESYPAQCYAGKKHFVEPLSSPTPTATPSATPKLNEAIRVVTPAENSIVKSPLKVSGEAVGGWFFEASFSIRMIDSNGLELGISHVQAKSDWMTKEFVPFEGVLQFKTPITETGTLILQNDNPSGLPEHSVEMRLPIRFK